MTYYSTPPTSDELYHYGIKGMKWGIRKGPKKYYNADRSLSRLGKLRDDYRQGKTTKEQYKAGKRKFNYDVKTKSRELKVSNPNDKLVRYIPGVRVGAARYMLNNNLDFNEARRRSRNDIIRALATSAAIRVASEASKRIIDKKLPNKPINFRKKHR